MFNVHGGSLENKIVAHGLDAVATRYNGYRVKKNDAFMGSSMTIDVPAGVSAIKEQLAL